MPVRVMLGEPKWAESTHEVAKARAKFELAAAAYHARRRAMKTLIQRSNALIFAAEEQLANLWNHLFKTNPGGVPLDQVMKLLWSSFEADVRFLCDHTMDEESHSMQSMAHAAGSALIGLRSMLMACIRNKDQPFSVDLMCEYIKTRAAAFERRLDSDTPSEKEAWGEQVSTQG